MLLPLFMPISTMNFTKTPLFRFLTQPDVSLISITADDLFSYYQQERSNNEPSQIYDSLSKDLEEVLDSKFFSKDILGILRNIKDNWNVSKFWNLFYWTFACEG